jgi:hypothetical protein
MQFAEDVGEFTLLIDKDRRGYTFFLVASRGEVVVADWKELDQDEMASYEDDVAIGSAVLDDG